MDDSNSYLVTPLRSEGQFIIISPSVFEYFIPTFYVNEIVYNPQIAVGALFENFSSISCGRCIASKYEGWYEIKFYENDAAIPLNMLADEDYNYICFKKNNDTAWPEIRWTTKYNIDDTFRNYQPTSAFERVYYVVVLHNKKNHYKILYYQYDNQKNTTILACKSEKWVSKLPKWFLEQFKQNNKNYGLSENTKKPNYNKWILYNLGDTTKIVTEALYEPKIISFQAICRGFMTRQKTLMMRMEPDNLFDKVCGNKRRRLVNVDNTYNSMKKREICRC